MKNRTLNLLLGSALIATLSPLQATETPKPNIVHIMIDDMGWQDIASHKIDGKPVYETPHLDRLTKDGLRFTEAYSPAPTCAPSRVAFLRGQHPLNTGVYHVAGGQIPRAWQNNSKRIPPYYIYGLPQSEPMIPEVLKKSGYVSGHVGKWHAGGKSAGFPFPLDQGFDFGFTEKGGRHKYYNDSDLWRDEDRIKNRFFGTWSSMKPDRLSDFATTDSQDPYQLDEDGRPFDKPLDLALGFMNKNKEKPFFLNFCPYYVHGPIGTRDRKRFEHYLKKMGYPFPTDPGSLDKGKPGHTNPYYASMVDTVDWMVGEVVTYLEETDDPRNPGHKLIDNTYLVVDSDNGGVLPYTDNRPLKGGKQNTWEGGVRIPFIVRGPGVKKGTSCDTPINLIDLFPTFMEMAGQKQDAQLKLDGANILPLLHGSSDQVVMPNGKTRDTLYWYFPMDSHMSGAMRKGDWKLVNSYGVNGGSDAKESVQLFRLYNEDGSMNDIEEKLDVADQHPEVCKAMLAELNQNIKSANAPMPYRNSLGREVPKEELASMPAVLELGVKGDHVWVTMEAPTKTGAKKAAIVEANLLYTLNPKPFDTTGGHREEWFKAPAKISQGRVEAIMPPGATHAAFCMRDANGFLITSEPMPSFQEVTHTIKNSAMLKNGYAYKPGLFALIKLGKQASSSSKKLGLDTKALQSALAGAQQQHDAAAINEKQMCDAIRTLRGAIRNQAGSPQAKHPLINRFPTDPLY
jgi:arylsulfatase A-like enzyme